MCVVFIGNIQTFKSFYSTGSEEVLNIVISSLAINCTFSSKEVTLQVQKCLSDSAISEKTAVSCPHELQDFFSTLSASQISENVPSSMSSGIASLLFLYGCILG